MCRYHSLKLNKTFKIEYLFINTFLSQQVSFGNMIACEYEGCSIEWFHYECVGITEAPKGKWYCNECSKSANVLTVQDDKKDKRRHYR